VNEAGQGHHDVSEQEMRVLELLADGHSDTEIAAGIGVTSAVLETHVDAILRKMESRSRTEAAVKAIKRGLLGAGVAAILVVVSVVSASDTRAFTPPHAWGDAYVECAGHSDGEANVR
jgi:DNA-binding CsgD family transcriptional regulator